MYAHLQKAVGAIQDFIIKSHYTEQAFEIEMYLKPGEIPIKKGEWIAISGNSGASEGPHLHYEVHKNGEKLNPAYFFYNDLTNEEYQLMLERASAPNQSFD